MGPRRPGDALRWLTDHNPKADQVETIDRPFPIQYGDRLTLPRSSGAAAALGPATGRHLVPDPGRHAVPAFNHQHRLLVGEPGHAGEGDCQVCPAEILGTGGLPDMLRLAARVGAAVTPRPVQSLCSLIVGR